MSSVATGSIMKKATMFSSPTRIENNAMKANQTWHQLSGDDILEILSSDSRTGLDTAEAGRRLQQYGPNTLPPRSGRGPLLRFLLQFHQPLIYILIASGIITALLGEWIDSSVIFGVVLVNGIIGYLQEAKAVNALAALARTLVSETTLLRQGVKTRLSSDQVVPGDIVLLEAGDRVPADLRILSGQGLQIDESALTGESLPVEKDPSPLPPVTELAERKNMAYGSTLVTHGQGKGIVVATGPSTEVGRISRLIAETVELETPLTRKISSFSRLLMYVILALAGVTVAVGLLRGQGFFDMFMSAVALAVGAIPEGLPAAVTITLAIGVGRMARRRAIIRRLPAVETLGSTTVICSDKTGTLTENKMTVRAVWAGGRRYEVTGSGYDPGEGKILLDGQSVDVSRHPSLLACLEAGMLCNDSLLVEKEDSWVVQGDPTEGALLAAAARGGLPVLEDPGKVRIDVVPFDSEHRFMATLHPDGDSEKIYVKGGLEVVLAACSSQLGDDAGQTALDLDTIHRLAEELGGEGLRIIALAEKKLPKPLGRIHFDDALSDLTFLGMQGMMDPPRQEAIDAVATCLRAGIKVKMITGDHALTAEAIAGKIGLIPPGDEIEGKPVITGRELDLLSDNELVAVVADTVVFARTSPEQKLRLVRALQADGEVVAMTGDGVNDAPALKQADIGVAMGAGGTEVAREASDMVLTDDNFQSIKAAVEEGRGVFDNLTKFIVWTLPTNLGEGLVIVAAVFLGITLPILPVQILWINMTTAGFLGLMLAFEPGEKDIMLRPPRDPRQPILTPLITERIIMVGILLLISTFILFELELKQGATMEQARTTAVNTFVVIELFYLFNCRSLRKSFFSSGFFSNPWVPAGAGLMLLVQLGFTYLPFMNRLFSSAPISPVSWLHILVAGVITFFIVEGEKWVARRFSRENNAADKKRWAS
ncbi:MAG: cation-transporting P-type ATPase [Desulfobulbaceae bacterium]